MPAPTWKELDERRLALGKRRLSRAQLARRAGLSESTIAKGIRLDRTPIKDTRQKVELVLEAERIAIEEGIRG